MSMSNRRESKDQKRVDNLEKQKERRDRVFNTVAYREFRPKTENQQSFLQCIRENRVTIGLGPAGTGKTVCSAYMAAKSLKCEQVNKILLVRPAVEAANTPNKNTLGYMPGDKDEKLSLYLRPLLFQLQKFFGEQEMKTLRTGEFPRIECLPLEHLRGLSIEETFVILDEAQNATKEQLKMFLTRLGQDSIMVINGDPDQSDLPLEMQGGLVTYANSLSYPFPIDGFGVVFMNEDDIVRDEMMKRILSRI